MISTVSIKCPMCRQWCSKPIGAANRAKKIGAPIYCGKVCSGLGRRKHRSDAEKKELKRLYDIEYRNANYEMLRSKKAERHKRTYDPVKAAEHRKTRMPWHVEYCRRPEYRKWKQEYDRQHRAREYGPFAEAYLIAVDLNKTIKQKASNYEIRTEAGTWGKAQRRKRANAAVECLGA